MKSTNLAHHRDGERRPVAAAYVEVRVEVDQCVGCTVKF